MRHSDQWWRELQRRAVPASSNSSRPPRESHVAVSSPRQSRAFFRGRSDSVDHLAWIHLRTGAEWDTTSLARIPAGVVSNERLARTVNLHVPRQHSLNQVIRCARKGNPVVLPDGCHQSQVAESASWSKEKPSSFLLFFESLGCLPHQNDSPTKRW